MVIVLHWHGWKAGQDGRGALRPPPVGLDDLKVARVTHAVVPMHHGEEDGYNYAQNLSDNGFKIIRNIERSYNAGIGLAYESGEVNLGKIIKEWDDAQHPGEFFSRFVQSVCLPCDGIAWNLEHNILDQSAYPVTAEDQEMIGKSSLADLRGYQFSLIFKMYRDALQQYAFGGRNILAVGYSGYPHLIHNGTTIQRAYGCDWHQQVSGVTFRSETLRGIDYCACAHCDFSIPNLTNKLVSNRTIHLANPIQEQPLGQLDQASLEKYTTNRLHNIGTGFGIGLALVAAHMRLPWGADDRRICGVVGRRVDLYLKNQRRKDKINNE